MARALVTGATGFIGAEVVRVLVEQGHEVTALARGSSAKEPIERLGARIVLGDLADAASLARAAEGVELVYHLATILKVPWRREFREHNIGGTRALAEACARRETPPTLVIVSSLAAAGPRPLGAPRREEDGAQPVSRYGRMKLDCELAALESAGRVPITVTRPPMVLGETDRWSVPLFRTAKRGFHVAPTFRLQEMSLVHVRDLAEGIVAAGLKGERARAGAPEGTGTYYLAADERPTYAGLGPLIAEAMGLGPPLVLRVPAAFTYGIAAVGELIARIKDQPTMMNLDKCKDAVAGSWICDAAKAKRELGFAPRPALERLAQTAKGYEAKGWL